MIYLDHHAAAPMPAVVWSAMEQAAPRAWANPSSTHAAGRESKRLLEDARLAVANSLGAAPADLVLTGGGTEACNLGIRGLAAERGALISTRVEHPAVAQSVRRLQQEGRELILLDVPEGTPPSPEDLGSVLRPHSLVAIQWVNHETGTVFPIEGYARACQARGAILFVDATQALGKLPIDVGELGVDALAVAAQKVGGPTGAGALWVRRGLDLVPVLEGGAQERGRHPGTPDTLSMVGFGAACRLVADRLEAQPRLAKLRDRIEKALEALGGSVNAGAPRVATATNLSFRGWEAALLVAALDLEGVCVSAGAACSSGLSKPSEVIAAMYPDAQWRAGSAVRISLGIETTDDDIDQACAAFARVLPRRGA